MNVEDTHFVTGSIAYLPFFSVSKYLRIGPVKWNGAANDKFGGPCAETQEQRAQAGTGARILHPGG